MSDALRPPDALRLLENRAWVRALARRLLSDENDVDDVEQETWAAALRSGPDEPRALRSWLGVVASRFALQRLRRRTRRARIEESAAGPERVERSPADVLAEADAHGHVVKAVLALDEPYRTTVLLRYFEGLAIADVARKMDVPLETVRTRLRRAHERLRASLEDEDRRGLALLLAPLAGEAAVPADGPKGAPSPSFVRVAVPTAAAVAVVAVATWWFVSGDDVASPAAPDAAPKTASAPPPSAPPRARSAAALANGVEQPKTAHSADAAASPTDVAPAAASVPPPWTARDLADGRPLANFALRIRTAAGESAVSTDATGRVPVERADVLDVDAALADVWKLARNANGAVPIRDEPSLWFWRERGVVGTATSADPSKPIAPTSIQLRWSLAQDFGAKDFNEPGRGHVWMQNHGFDFFEFRDLRASIDADGRFRCAAPAVRGATLVASAPEFAPAATLLSWEGDADCVVSLRLRPWIVVEGRVLDEDGNPVSGRCVALDTYVEPVADADLARLQKQCGRSRGGWGFGHAPSGAGVFRIGDQPDSDVRGIFRILATNDGPAVITAWREGFVADRKELGVLDKDVVVELRLRRSTATVEIRDADGPIASARLLTQVADQRENGFFLTTDAKGRVETGRFQLGREYSAGVFDDHAPQRSVTFRWQGQPTLQLERPESKGK